MMTSSVTAPSPTDHGAPPPLPHPHPPRRPRVREVSSRFMSPAPSPAGDLHSVTFKHSISTPAPDRSVKPSPSPSQRRLLLRSQAPEPFSSSENIPETSRSMETPFQSVKPELAPAPVFTQRKQRAVKVFKENGGRDRDIQVSKSLRSSKPSRPDTPSDRDRIVPSRFMLPHRQTNSSTSDASKLLKSTGLSLSSSDDNSNNGYSSDNDIASQKLNKSQSETKSVKGGSCPNSPISLQHAQTWPVPDCSSANSSLCTRSLNLPISGSHTSFKTIDRSLCKPGNGNSVSTEMRALPPQPTGVRLLGDSKKGKKIQCSQQDILSLQMHYNRYLQWRFANAKAEASMNAQRKQMENQVFSLGAEISNLRDSVKRKRVELAMLQQMKTLSTILEAQMPYLDEWSALEEDYTISVSEVITALTNSLIRLPISGNVQVNIKDTAEALDSAVQTTNMIVNQMQRFFPKAEEMDGLMSKLANVTDVKRALIEECGNLLAENNILQVEECSLQVHLVQSKTINDDAFVHKSRC